MNGTRRLHIGAKERQAGWEVFNIIPSEIVDHVGDARDLSRFPDGTFGDLYASHVLEHFDYREEVGAVLLEWKRVLAPGGKISISVPNMDVLCYLFSHPDVTSLEDKYKIMRIMFGGYMDRYDYHNTGFFPELLHSCLANAGFDAITTVERFGIFADGSGIKCAGIDISINMTAVKPQSGG